MRIICPICKEETTREENPDIPFCSNRCKMIDLGKWVNGDYRVEGSEMDEDLPEGLDGEQD